jgi:hypothetical protein
MYILVLLMCHQPATLAVPQGREFDSDCPTLVDSRAAQQLIMVGVDCWAGDKAESRCEGLWLPCPGVPASSIC